MPNKTQKGLASYIRRHFGSRCEQFDVGCSACLAWHSFDYLYGKVGGPVWERCAKCNTGLAHAPGIAIYCPNDACDVFDNLDGAKRAKYERVEFEVLGEVFETGSGQRMTVHAELPSCAEGCVVHAPTDHSMRDFPTYWRSDRGLMERLCPHGVGHPDPDDLRFKESQGLTREGVHGCDGCCTGAYQA